MQLSGWQRIGVVISILWIIGGGLLGNNIGIHEGDYVVQELQICEEAHNADLKMCYQKFDKDWPAAISNHWIDAVFFGLVPIPLGWLTVYGIVALLRWIRAGFKVTTSQN